MKISQVLKGPKGQTKVGYTSFPMDNLTNFTSIVGYLLPVYYDFLEPGDKVTIKNRMRTITQPLTKPAMATIIERLEWFAVPIDQLYKPFKTKYFGINDVETDLLPTSGYNNSVPFINGAELDAYLKSCPTSFAAQQAIPVTRPTYAEVKRLYDCLGYPQSVGTLGTGETFGFSANVLLPAAYQKIYYDHFRLTDRFANDPQAYNFDSFHSTSSLTNSSNQARLDKLFQLRKRPYRLDYFTSMKVSPLMGSSDVNASGSSLTNINQWLTGLSGLQTSLPTSVTLAPNGGTVSVSNSLPTTVNLRQTANVNTNALQANLADAVRMVNPANIRSLFAVEKLLEVTRRAKKHYDMQVLAHFGVDVPKGLAGECFKLGTHEQTIQIGNIMNTADNGTAALGERAGVGSSEGSMDKPIKFDAKCHCILMAIYSAEPLMNYPQVGIDRLASRVSVDDFFKPEFNNLGMQPVFAREVQCVPELTSNITATDVVGWQPRYFEQKCKANRSFAGMITTYFEEWSLNRDVINSTQLSSQLARSTFFEVWPTDINNILVFKYSGTGNSTTNVYSEDHLINQIYFDVVKTSKKSIYGVPNL